MATAQFLHTINPEKWTLTDPEKRPNGSSSAWVNSSDGGRPVFQAIKGDVAFEPGYGKPTEQISGGEDMTEKMPRIEINIRSENPDAQTFTGACDMADQALVRWAVEHSLRLFRQQLDAATVSKLLRPLVKAPQPSEAAMNGAQAPKVYPPRLRVKIAKDFVTDKEGRQIPNPRKTQVFVVNSDTTYRRGTIQEVCRGCEVICIVEVPSAWISGMFLGFNCIASQILVYPNAARASSALTFNLPTPMVMDHEHQPQEGDMDM